MDERNLHSGLPPELFEGEQDVNLLGVNERVKQLAFSLSEVHGAKDMGTPTDIANIKKSIDFTFAIVDNILQNFLRDVFPKIIINTPSINFGELSLYLGKHEIQIGISDVSSDNIDLLVVTAHEYGHAIIYELVRLGLFPKIPEVKYQEQFCDFIAGYCLRYYHENFDGVYDKGDYVAGKRTMKKLGDSSEISSIHSHLNPIFLDKFMFPELRNKPITSKNEHGTGPQRRERFEKGYNSDKNGLITAFMKLITLPHSERMKKEYTTKYSSN